MKISIQPESPFSPDAAELLAELSAELMALTGSSGTGSFDPADAAGPRAVFAVARDEQGHAVGCGALRPFDETTVEIKRVYAKIKDAGIGSAVLAFLEVKAEELGFERLVLETRRLNEKAVGFYRAKGYVVIDNFGRYRGRDEAICLEKRLANAPV